MWTEDLYYCKRGIDPESPLNLTMSGLTYCDGTYRVRRENSPFFLFEYILEGEGVVRVGSRSCLPGRGDVYILHGGSSYEYYSSPRNPWKKIWFTVTGPLVDPLLQAYGLTGIHYPERNVLPWFEKIQGSLKEGGIPYGREEITLLFHGLLIHIARGEGNRERLPSPEALAMREYLLNRIEEPVTLEEMGRRFCKCPTQIIRLFKREFGTTPYEFLVNQRVETAKQLLHNTSLPIKEIALRLQYADEHYFSNFFKSRTGQSPSRFRREGPVKYL